MIDKNIYNVHDISWHSYIITIKWMKVVQQIVTKCGYKFY